MENSYNGFCFSKRYQNELENGCHKNCYVRRVCGEEEQGYSTMASPFNCTASPIIPLHWLEEGSVPAGRLQLLTAIYCVMVIAGISLPLLFWFAKHRLRYESLRVRSTSLVMLIGAACLIHAQVGPGFLIFGAGRYPCWLRSFLAMLVVPFFCANILIKLMTFYFMHQLSRGMTKVDRVDDDAFQSGKAGLCSSMGMMFYSLFSVLRCRKQEEDVVPQSRVIAALSFVTSNIGVATIAFLFCFVSTGIAAILMSTMPEVLHGCMGCNLSIDEIVEIILVGGMMIVFATLYTVRVWDLPDLWQLRSEVLATAAFGLIAVVGFVCSVFFDLGREATFDHQVELCFAFISILLLQSAYQVVKAHRKEPKVFSRYRAGKTAYKIGNTSQGSNMPVSAMTSDADNQRVAAFGGAGGPLISFAGVMKDEAMAKAFEEFLVAELSVESLMFIKDTDAWKRNYHSVTPSARLARAKRIYNVYIAPNASFEINISSNCAKSVREVFAEVATMEDVPVNEFDEAREEIIALLQYGSIRRFQFSKEYKDLATSSRVGNLL